MRSLKLCPLVLIAAVAAGMPNVSGPPPGPDYATSAALTLNVDPTGSDSNTCLGTGTAACLTIQGALNKISKMLRYIVAVNVAAGTYGGFTVSGFSVDTGVQQASAGLYINGTLATSTLATGSATGTAAGAGQSAGLESTFGVLCDSGATWTVNDLRGRFITTASPTNTGYVVSSNTATCVTIVGTWSLPVAGQTTYTIQDPAVIINTAVSLPPNAILPTSANRAAIEFNDNNITYRLAAIGMTNMRLSNALGRGIEITDSSMYRFTNLQVRNSGANRETIIIGGQGPVHPRLDLDACDMSVSSSTQMTVVSGGIFGSTRTLWRNSGSALSGVVLGETAPMDSVVFDRSELLALGQGSGCALCFSSGPARGSTFIDTRVSCATTTSTGVYFGELVANAVSFNKTGSPVALSNITRSNITGCGTGVGVMGPAAVDIVGISGSATTTGIAAWLGGVISFNLNLLTMTAGTNEISLDSGALTALYADVPGVTGLATGPQGSKVFSR